MFTEEQNGQNQYEILNNLGPTVQTLDSAIHQINHYPMDKYYKN